MRRRHAHRARRDRRGAARRRGVRLRHRAAGGGGLHHDAGVPPRHLPGGRRDAEPRAAARFNGKPEFVENFFRFIAEDMRRYLAELGFRSIDEAVGHADVLDTDAASRIGRARARTCRRSSRYPRMLMAPSSHSAGGCETRITASTRLWTGRTPDPRCVPRRLRPRQGHQPQRARVDPADPASRCPTPAPALRSRCPQTSARARAASDSDPVTSIPLMREARE